MNPGKVSDSASALSFDDQLSSPSNLPIILFGTVCLDTVLTLPCPISSDMKTYAKTNVSRSGGNAFNAWSTVLPVCATLKTTCLLVSTVGEDKEGKCIEEECRVRVEEALGTEGGGGIGFHLFKKVGRTVSSTVIVGSDGGRTCVSCPREGRVWGVGVEEARAVRGGLLGGGGGGGVVYSDCRYREGVLAFMEDAEGWGLMVDLEFKSSSQETHKENLGLVEIASWIKVDRDYVVNIYGGDVWRFLEDAKVVNWVVLTDGGNGCVGYERMGGGGMEGGQGRGSSGIGG